MGQDRFRNVGNLVLVEPNRIRDLNMPAVDRYLLTFYVKIVAYMHLLFDYVRYSPNASSNVN